MQSDKHLNNMQELSNSQNLNNNVAAGASGASSGHTANDIRESPKLMLPSIQSQQPTTPQQQASAGAASASNSNKPKASFRCGVCSYETSVARNLRIHWTSEKHTHNMAVLENNVKHLTTLGFLQQQSQAGIVGGPLGAQLPNLPAGLSAALQQQQQQQLASAAAAQNMTGLANLQNFLPEAALADLAYNQALMIQLLQQNNPAAAMAAAAQQQPNFNAVAGNTPGNGSNGTVSLLNAAAASGSGNGSGSASNSNTPSASSTGGLEADLGLNPDSFEPPIEPDQRPTTLYSCLVCANFNTNQLDELNQHLLIDRSRTISSSQQQDIMLIINNNYICRLCNYKTPLKANFQLHSKTDKHIQKLNYINHIKEGGVRNEYKLKYNSNNAIQLKCNCCDYYTNSIQKLNLHTQNMRHENMKIIFNHLLVACATVQATKSNNMECLSALSSSNDIDNPNHSNDLDENGAGSGSGSGSGSANNSLTNNNIVNNNSSNNDVSNKCVLLCQLCNFKANHVLGMVQHVKSLRHVQIEQIICLQRRNENLDTLELSDVFKGIESGKSPSSSTFIISLHVFDIFFASSLIYFQTPSASCI